MGRPSYAAKCGLETSRVLWRASTADGAHFLASHGRARGQAGLCRLAPGGRIDLHSHPGGEEIFVLDGAIEDEHGAYPKGCWLRCPPGSSHAPRSPKGALLWVKSGHLGTA